MPFHSDADGKPKVFNAVDGTCADVPVDDTCAEVPQAPCEPVGSVLGGTFRPGNRIDRRPLLPTVTGHGG